MSSRVIELVRHAAPGSLYIHLSTILGKVGTYVVSAIEFRMRSTFKLK